jgi:inner membrane transporter RhtA
VIPALGPSGTVALRLGLGMLILLAIVRPNVRRLTRRDVAAVVGFGVVLGVMNLSFYEALARLPMGVAVTIEFIGPLGLAAALSRRRRDIAAVSLAALGVVAVNGRELGHINWAGVGFALLAGTMWAAYVLLSGETGQRLPKLDGLALAMVVASAIVAPLGIGHAGSTLLAPRYLLLGLAIAILSSVLPYSLELIALRRLAPSVFGVLMSLEPAVAASWASDSALSNWPGWRAWSPRRSPSRVRRRSRPSTSELWCTKAIWSSSDRSGTVAPMSHHVAIIS